MKKDITNLQIRILRRMVSHDVWGKHHWREDTMKKGFAPEIKKLVMKSAKQLRREGYLIMKPTPHGKQWHLNRKRVKEIFELIE